MKRWVIRGVGQGFTEPLDGGVHPVVEVDERVVRPEPPPQLVASDHLAWPFQQALEELERLLLEVHPHPRPSQVAGAHVQLEHAEPKHGRRRCRGGFHRTSVVS